MSSNEDSAAAASRGLLGLPLVLVREIFELVYNNGSPGIALSELRLTSRVCRRECERLMVRSLNLSDTESFWKKTSLRSRGLLKRLQDPNDELAEHVRELWLGPFDNNDYFANEVLRYEADGMSIPYSIWFKTMDRASGEAIRSPVISEPQEGFVDGKNVLCEALKKMASRKRAENNSNPGASAPSSQHEVTTETAWLGLAPSLLSSIQQLLRDPDSIAQGSDFGAVLWDNEGYVSPVLGRAIRNMTNLCSVTWNTNFLFPRDVLRILQQNHPSVHINVHQPMPALSNAFHMDCTLLSSPQLHSADIYVYGTPHTRDDFQKSYSEYRLVKNCLARGNSIKRLTLKCDGTYNWGWPTRLADGSALIRWNRITEGPMNFDWQESDRFPALKEFTLPLGGLYLSKDHCDMWVRCMDWSHLVHLDVGRFTPQRLFVALTGRVSQLQKLRFGYWPKWAYRAVPECESLSLIKPFLDSISALQDLSFSCHDIRLHPLPIFEAQQHSLRRLKIEENYQGFYDSKAIEEEGVLLRLLENFPGLTSAEFAICSPPFEAEWDAHLTPRQKLGLMLDKRMTTV
ncbi:hypothetical protein DPSP01_011717 [Paraphaeosphaeria sporulosa]